jgi:hypothetical protein
MIHGNYWIMFDQNPRLNWIMIHVNCGSCLVRIVDHDYEK